MSTLVCGAALGRYTLGEKLGEGTFAEVWRATEQGDLGFRSEVALKVLRPARLGEKERAALLKEARLCAELRHPNIVGVRGLVEHGGLLLVVMDLVEGGTLAELLERAREHGLTVPRSVVVDVGLDMARGLAHAWGGTRDDGTPFSVVHRDLKPGNVLLGVLGEAQIADFGIARAAGDATATEAGMLKGTPAYVAPEIWLGGRDFRPAVDLFAVGCILFELATLRRVFSGTSIPELFSQVAHGDARQDVAPVRESFPALAPVLERLLQRDPALRTQGAPELEAELARIRVEVWEGLDVSAFLAVLDALEGKRRPAASPLLRKGPFADPAWERARQAVLALPALPATPERPAPGPTRLMAGYGRGARAWLRGRRLGILLAGLACAAIVAASILVVEPPPAEQPEASPAVAPGSPPEIRLVEMTPEPATAPPRREEVRVPRREEREVPPADPVTPAPSPEPSAPPPPVPVAGPGCLVFQSVPPGAEVWVDGQPAGLRARSGAGAFLERAAGMASVQMGVRGAPAAEITVTVRPGWSHVVRCDLAGGSGCRVSEAPGGCR